MQELQAIGMTTMMTIDCEMLSVSQNYRNTIKCYLHDAVYLYLLTVNQTLAEGYADYRNGHLIRNKTIGQRFAGKRWR